MTHRRPAFSSQLRTADLRLRPLVVGDAARFSELAGVPEVARMTGSFPLPLPEFAARALIDIYAARAATGRAHHWAVESDGTLIGVLGLDRHAACWEVGYWLGQDFWGRGFGTQVLSAALGEMARVLPGTPVRGTVFNDNPASLAILQRAGFVARGAERLGFSMARMGSHPVTELWFQPQRDRAEAPEAQVA